MYAVGQAENAEKISVFDSVRSFRTFFPISLKRGCKKQVFFYSPFFIIFLLRLYSSILMWNCQLHHFRAVSHAYTAMPKDKSLKRT